MKVRRGCSCERLVIFRISIRDGSMSTEKIFRISIRQVKAARELLGWKQTDLAAASGLSIVTIRRIESAGGELGGRADTAAKIVAALEEAGIVFLDEGDVRDGGAGVRLKRIGPVASIPIEDLNAENDE
jgi:transcriptional regulator with XRE-family HTH domain